MTILHYNPDADSMIAQYVAMLSDAMSHYAVNATATSLAQFRKMLADTSPDIVHLHGCWHSSVAVAAYWGRRHGARIVLSPHGQLEPWVLRDRYVTFRLPRLIAFLHRVVRQAYALIAMGNMEQRCIKRFTSNPRVEVVLNAVTTCKISEADMARSVYAIYNKVLDSNTLQLMDDDTRDILATLIKAGVTGDVRWVEGERQNAARSLSDDTCWRQILLYAHHENIMDVVRHGMEVTGAMPSAVPDVAAIPCYMPKGFKQARAFTLTMADVNEQVIYIIKALQKEASHNMISVNSLVQLQKLLYGHEINEEKLAETLSYHDIDRFAARLMAVMEDMTLLDEGYMILPPLRDRKAQRLQAKIENRLTI